MLSGSVGSSLEPSFWPSSESAESVGSSLEPLSMPSFKSVSSLSVELSLKSLFKVFETFSFNLFGVFKVESYGYCVSSPCVVLVNNDALNTNTKPEIANLCFLLLLTCSPPNFKKNTLLTHLLY